nr:nucleotidyl transferase AbiEii/AbiGii toxin family protein [Sinorhizobium meliloti]
MRRFTISAAALGDKLKQSARNHGLDVNKSASRHVAQAVVQELDLRTCPFVVAGGLTIDPRLRETADADLVAIRRISNREIQNAFKTFAPWLRNEGIEIKALSREPREIVVPYSNPVDRWRVTATAGNIRADFDLDVTWANGLYSRPTEPVVYREIPSIMKGVPSFRARMQPQATSAAQKLLAVLMQPRTDLRVKHLADVVNGYLWSDDLDCRTVAAEIARICTYRGIPMSVCEPHPNALRWTEMRRLEANWDADRNARRSGLSLTQAWIDVNGLWANVHEELLRNVVRDVRSSDYSPQLLESIIAEKRTIAPVYKPF